MRIGLVAGALLILATSALAARPTFTPPPDLPEEDQRRVQQVTEHVSVWARANGEAFLLRQDVFEYLLDHPEFATHVIRALRVGRYRLWREPDGLWLDDGAGAVGQFRVVHAASGSRLIYVRGLYKPKFLPAIRGRVVVVLEYAARPATDGKSLITPVLTGLVRIDNLLIEMLSKLLSAVAAEKAEAVTRRLVADFAKTARAIDGDPVRVHDELRRRPDVPQRELEEFRRILKLP